MRKLSYIFIVFLVVMNCNRPSKELSSTKSEDVFCSVDSLKAEEMAWQNWKQLYGEQVIIYAPLIFRQTDTTWIITGTLPKNYKGGIPGIEIFKTNGKVLKVYHTK